MHLVELLTMTLQEFTSYIQSCANKLVCINLAFHLFFVLGLERW